MKKIILSILFIAFVFASIGQNLKGYYVEAYSKLEAKRAFVIDLDTFYATTQLNGLDTILVSLNYVTQQLAMKEPANANIQQHIINDNDTVETNELQTIDTFRIASNILELSLSSDGQPKKTVDLSAYVNPSLTNYVQNSSTSTDNAVARFDGTTGKLIQNSAVTISDAGAIVTPSTIQATTGLFTNLSGNSVPYASSGGLANSIVKQTSVAIMTLQGTTIGGWYINGGNATGTGGGYTMYQTDATNKFIVGTETAALGGTSGGGIAYVYGNFPFKVHTNGANRLTIDANGGTFTGYVQGTTGKFTNLTDTYIPKHTSDATGLENSNVFFSSNIARYGTANTFSNDRDIVDKAYVDAIGAGNMPKLPVDAATTANITLSGTQTIDGYAVSAGQRVLVKNQSTTSANGVYIVASGAWSRSTDLDTWAELYKAYVAVLNGGQTGSSFVCNIASTGTLETDPITWVLYTAPTNILAGDGLTKTGSTIAVNFGGTGTATTVSRTDHTQAATTISDGSIDNTEFDYLNGVSSNIQTQLDGKQATLTTGDLTESVTGLELSAIRQVIGGAATLSLTTGYVIPTTTEQTNWQTAYANRITSLTTTGSSGAATLVSNTLNIPNYTLAGLGGQPQLNGTGFVKVSGTTVSYDNSVYLTSYTETDPIFNLHTVKNIVNGTGFLKNTAGVWSYDNSTYSLSTHTHSGIYEVPLTFSTGLNRIGNTITSTITQYTDALARGAISLTTTGNSGASTYSSTTGVLNVPTYTLAGLGGIALTSLSSTATGLTYTNTTGVFSLTSGYIIPTTSEQTNWNTAYSDRMKWDGGSTGLVPATGRTSLGATTIGGNIFTSTNPSAITFLRANADNTVSWLDAATFRTAIGAGTSSTNGTVTSVAMTVPTGLSISGTPITTSGTLAVTLTSGYSIPTTANQTNWNTAYGWGNHASQGYLTQSLFNSGNPDLAAIEALAGTTGLLKKTAANTWTLDNSVYLTSYTETDPIWTSASTNYYTKTNLQTSGQASVHWDNITNEPTFLTSYTETDPIFNLHTVKNIINGTGFLKNNGSGVWSWDNSTYLTGNQTITISGDASGSGTTAITLTVADDSHNHNGTTISGLAVADFTSPNISNWTNDANYADKDLANIFLDDQTIQSSAPYLFLRSTSVGGTSTLRFKDESDLPQFSIQYDSNNDRTLITSNNHYISTQIGALEVMNLATTGQLKLPQYTGTTFDGTIIKYLGVDASGNVVKGTVSSGVTDHSALSNLSYATAGHTDFVSTNTTQTISAVKTFSANPIISANDGNLRFTGTNSASIDYYSSSVFKGGIYFQSSGRVDLYAGEPATYSGYFNFNSEVKLPEKATPVNTNRGTLYFDTDDNTFRGYNGSSWVDLGSSGGSMVYPSAGIPVSNGSAWLTSVSGTALQVLRRNAGNTAYEFYTLPAYLTSEVDGSTGNELNISMSYTASTRTIEVTDNGGTKSTTIPLFTSTEAGLTPLSGGGTTNFLRADGTWAAPTTSSKWQQLTGAIAPVTITDEVRIGNSSNRSTTTGLEVYGGQYFSEFTVQGGYTYLQTEHSSAPSNPAQGGILFTKSDNQFYYRNEDLYDTNLSAKDNDFTRFPMLQTDFLGPAGAGTAEAAWGFDYAVIASGTQAKIASEANHPGILRTSSSTTTNSGGYCMTDNASVYISGGEVFECIFQPRVASNTNTTIRIGFMDSYTSTAPVDGCYFELAAGTLNIIGINRYGTTNTTSTATVATLTVNTWYRLKIEVNSAASSVTYTVYNSSGTVLGTQTNTGTIPTGSTGRETGCGVIATNSGTTATLLAYWDMMSYYYNKPLVR